MKRWLFMLLFSSLLVANPITPYVFQFNEFGFDEHGDWWLELHSDFYYEFSPALYDSLIISSSTESAKADTIRSIDENSLVLIMDAKSRVDLIE